MKIFMPTLTYRLTVKPPRAGLSASMWTTPVSVRVSVTASNPEEFGPIRFLSDITEAAEQIGDWLSVQVGPFGHLIGEVTAPTDLSFVMGTDAARVFEPELISGGELIPDAYPTAPEGTVF